MPVRKRWLLILLALAGCQRYSPRSLDLPGHGRTVLARDPASAEVAAYAKKLREDAGDAPEMFDPTDGFSLEEGRVLALFFNPRLRVTRLEARVPLAGAQHAGRWEDPELRVDAERIIASVEHPWVVGGLLGLTLPISGRLKVEKKLARDEAEVAELRAQKDERDLIVELTESWLEWSATVERAALTRSMLAELEKMVETAEKLRAAGELDPLDARLFRIERMTQIGKLQSLEAEARRGEIEIKGKMGLAAEAPVRLIPTVASGPVTLPAESGPDWVERHPQIRLTKAAYQVAERQLELEVRRQYPDLALGGGFGEDEGDPRVLGEFALPLPLWNANRRGIAEARAKRDAARAEAEGEFERMMLEYALAREELTAAGERVRFVESELAPLADEQLAAARQLTRLGDHNTLVLLEAVKTAYEARGEVLEARLKLAWARARLRAMVGDAVSTPTSRPVHGKAGRP